MKRSRFSEMVPPTPEDFHGSVVDALHRLDRVPRRRASGMTVLAASLAAVLVLAAVLLAVASLRGERPDVVVNPGQASLMPAVTDEPTSAPAEETTAPAEETPVPAEESIQSPAEELGIRFDIGRFDLRDESLVFDWNLSVPGSETLLFSMDFGAIVDGWTSTGRGWLTGSLPGDALTMLPLIGKELQEGVGNGVQIGRTENMNCFNAPTDAVVLMLKVGVYRPAAPMAFYDAAAAKKNSVSFENQPAWLVMKNSDGTFDAMAIDYYGRYEYQTPYGSDLLQKINADFSNTYPEPGTEEELSRWLSVRSDLRHSLLGAYGFAQRLIEFDVRVEFDPSTGEAETTVCQNIP